MLLEEPPAKATDIVETDLRSSHIIAISAKTLSSFEGSKQRLLRHIRRHPELRIRDIAYTTTARRMHQPIRKAFCASTLEDLEVCLAKDTAQRDHPSSPPTVVFMFPGQGLSFQGYAKQLYDTCNTFKNDILELDRLGQTLGLPSFLQTLLEPPGDESAGRTEVELQLALVALEMAMSRLLTSWGIRPDLVVGHSLGEYGALHAAGVLSAADTMFLVGNRARLIERLCAKGTHGMLSVGAPSVVVRRILDQHSSLTPCELTCFNTPHTTVLGGPLEALQTVERLFSEQHGLRCSMLRTAYAYHSAQLDPILESYTQLAKGVRFSAPDVAVASTVEGRVVEKGTPGLFSARYVADHARKAVRFEQALSACETGGLVGANTILIEVGPGAMCLSMSRSTLRQPGNLLPCLKTGQDTWEALSSIVAQAYTKGLPVSWAEYHGPYASDLSFIDLPTYSFELKDFWLPYRGGTAAMEEEIKRLEQRVVEATQALPATRDREEEMLSSSIHRIDQIDLAGDCGSISFVSDIGRAPLRNLIEGHNVVGVLLTPACVYAEMAAMAARQFFELAYPEKRPPPMEVRNTSIFAPLALRSDRGVQLVTIAVVRETADKAMSVTIASDKNHARCEVFLLDDGGQSRSYDWPRRHYLVHDRAMALVAKSNPHDDVHRILRGMVYRIFSSVTQYSADYHSIAAIYINADFCEAAVQLETRETPAGCSFTHDPTWQDGIAQAAGFMVNASLSRPEDMLYVMTGWENMSLTESLGPGKRYLCHVRASAPPGLEATVKCDVTVMDDSTIVAMGEGLTFKRIKMASLQSLVTSPPRSATTKSEPTRAITSSSAKGQSPELGTKGRKAKVAREPREEDTRLAKVLHLISDETGASMAELADDATLGDLGVDSLLSVAVASKLATDLGIELPAVLLLGTVTIAEIRAHFDGTNHDHGSWDSTASESSSESMAAPSTPKSNPSSISDPPSPSLAPPIALLGEALMTAVAAEAGMERADLDEDTSFQDVGLDSLMSVAVIGAVKDKTGVELPASLFNDTKDIREARSRIEAMFGYSREERAGTGEMTGS